MLKRVLDIVGWLGVALVLASVAVFFLKFDWAVYARWIAWAGLVCLLLYTLGQWREIVQFFGRRQTRLGSLTVISVLIVAGILLAINYIAARENKRWDLTANGVYTLSEQSKKVVANLDAPLKMIVFAMSTDFDRYRQRLPEYEYASKKVSVEYVDPDKNPSLARQYQVQSYGTIVLLYKDRTERVTSDSEQDVTNGIIKVVTGKEKKIYFTQGHGEKDPTSSERTGYNAIAAALKGENDAVDKLVLAQQTDVPADATEVVVAGPKTDFLAPETDMLRRYLQKGGKAVFLLDPPEDQNAPPLANLTALLKDWDIELGNNVVVDVSGMGQLLGTDASVPVAASYPSHPITDRFNLLTAYPLARSVSPISGGVNGRYAQPFVETGQRSWAETDIKALMSSQKVAFDESKGDKRGPISIAAAVSATAPGAAQPAPADKNGKKDQKDQQKPETRVAVVGDSDFAANFALGIQGNKDLFMNIVNWAGQQENLIAIRPREPDDRRITLTAGQQQAISWLSLVIVPGLILVSGIYTWWRRR